MKNAVQKSLGQKHVCHQCKTPFYDLQKRTPQCPKCLLPLKSLKKNSASSHEAKQKQLKANDELAEWPLKSNATNNNTGLLEDLEELDDGRAGDPLGKEGFLTPSEDSL